VQLQTGVGSQHIIKGKLATGPQHAPELTVNSLSVWNIHDDMLGPHHVEAAVRKMQSQEVTDLVADQGAQTGSLREQLCYGDKRRLVAISKLIFCTIPALNPSQRLAHRERTRAPSAEAG